MKSNTTYTTVHHAANELGLSVNWLRKQARQGVIPHLRQGRQYKFCVADVRDYLAEQSKRMCKSGVEQ